MNLIKTLTRLLTKLGFNKRRVLTYRQVSDILSDLKPLKIEVQDNEYRLYSKNEVKTIFYISRVYFNFYLKELYDCDDFTLDFMQYALNKMPGVPLGMAHVSYVDKKIARIKHALNVFIDDKQDIYFIDPQSGEITRPRKDWKVNFILI